MEFFFVRDRNKRDRFFCSEPISQPGVRFSRWKVFWEAAKKRLMLLPRPILAQEQAFGRAPAPGEPMTVFFSGRLTKRRIRRRFTFFLHRRRTGHIALLVVEALLLPLSGLMALLPGPNVFFGILALVMITHWQALRGINRLLRAEPAFRPDDLLERWEDAVERDMDEEKEAVLDRLVGERGLEHARRILTGGRGDR